ncbi:transglutaminase family protein [Rhabdochromatium marinum]|uniref:transglutaminase family protein n=1 Tax=Rhabdochromatium marinum TaxID=48729 RepID=UPI0019075655|nr:transglutaminase family protein [Rhabdochromatium marinum]MBK1649639.1 transglutaminase [Rhabdochromatium marinum]
MKYRISHVTRYAYSDPVSLCHSIAHLKPRSMPHQRVINASLRITPWPSVTREHQDFFGNRVSYFSLQQSHSMLEISAASEVEVDHQPVPGPDADPPWEASLQQLQDSRDPEHLAARSFTLPSPAIDSQPDALAFAQPSFAPGRPLLEATTDLMHRIYQDFEYDPSFTTVATPLSEVLAHRRGVCQDFAHLGIAALRGLGLAARYVSGYLETLPPPDKPKLRGADASHAWFAVFIPGHGWVDLDPTNNCLLSEQHITTAIGRDYQDVTPVRGVFYGGGEHELSVAVDVDRILPTEPAS